jgi:Putative zinc dependent peptidase (DUF5700)
MPEEERNASIMAGRAFLVVATLLAIAPPAAAADDELTLVTDEADAALAIISAQAGGGQIHAADWERLVASEGYGLLQRREASMKRPFTDDDFRAFLTARTTVASAPALARTLSEWKTRSAAGAARLAHAYLPPDTPLRARVLVVIKPTTNSFVFHADGASLVFLHLDPKETPARFENTLGHELHHIGLDAVCREPRVGTYAPEVALARRFVGAFGEGFAMLAAAGGPDVHPHAVGSAEDRARWDRDLGRFEADLRAVERFLADILDGKVADEGQADAAARPFWGAQGAWYTVGWKMAVSIEKRFGRDRLVRDECDPVALLADYDAAAPSGGARWSDALLRRLAAEVRPPAEIE